MAFPLFRSLSKRFAWVMTVTAIVTFVAFISFVYHQMSQGLLRQALALEQFSDAKLATRLDEEANLAAARLRFLATDVAHRVEAIADRSDARKAVESRNSVAMSELLRPVAKVFDIDGIIVLDAGVHVIGESSGTADLLDLQMKLKTSPLQALAAAKIARSDIDHHAPFETFRLVTPDMQQVLRTTRAGSIVHVLIQPLFDDFGDVNGAMIAYRSLRASEPLLEEFAKLTNSGIAIYVGDRILSQARLDSEPTFPVSHDGSALLRTAGNDRIARCIDLLGLANLCAFAPVSELYESHNQLIEIGNSEGSELVKWLLGVGALATGLFAAIAYVVAGQITLPLSRITQAVTGVAAGDCMTRVDGIGRIDEVGDIARAVVSLQDSIRERDALRLRAIRQNAELARREVELNHSLALLDAALGNMSHGLCMFDRDNRVVVSNARFEAIYDIAAGRIRPGMALADVLKLSFQGRAGDAEGIAELAAELVPALRSTRPCTVVHSLDNGRTVLITRQPMTDQGWVAIYEDITESRRAQARLVHMANHDSLTNLPNRTLLRRRLEEELHRTIDQESSLALIYLDLDEFKIINDSLGHPVGDQLLCQVAERLLGCVQSHDLVARLGGDEFAIICARLDRPDRVETVAQMIIEEIGRPFQLDDHEVVVGVSIGIAIAFHHGDDPNELVKQADLALYRAKSEGKNTYRYYQPEMEVLVKVRRELLIDLRQAVINTEFEPYFQPQINLESGRIIGFEALIRWNHPQRGRVSPLEFIPLAEETGLIVPIGSWMLLRACQIAAGWTSPVRIAVNISSKQIKVKGLFEDVASVLQQTGLDPARLELEITESVLLEETDEIVATLMQIKQLGVKISMDDFGTGYSSLSCLRRFPFDKIKIDQSFVRTMATDPEARAIVASIIQLAKTLGITTTAEGVETEDLVDMLRDIGCTEVQGYYFGAPQPALVAEGLLLAFQPVVRPPVLRTVA